MKSQKTMFVIRNPWTQLATASTGKRYSLASLASRPPPRSGPSHISSPPMSCKCQTHFYGASSLMDGKANGSQDWFLCFVKSIEEVVVFSMDPFVTSAFNKHSITPAIQIVAIIIGGLSYIPLAKILDTWG
ncbi:hypothetical protein J3458_004428 [Metarhizium acridum]|uniref:uncharacterized protein n=1 Tax=Metarhizium acridum TaxID=92637 RepID=UPI001C6CE1D9|nr:hypothetical protein J3458_004428 [Metarhizium acridum]